MTPQNNLEQQGNFLTHPFAELLAEISQAGFTGSLRVSANDRKTVIYFKEGLVAFAVANSRSTRLSEMLLRQKKIEPDLLKKLPKFSSDLEFAAILNEGGFFSKDETDQFVVRQIEGILVDVLSWPEGDWVFSPLTRLKDSLKFGIETHALLIDHARRMRVETVLGRFRRMQGSFSRTSSVVPKMDLRPNEILVMSRIMEGPNMAEALIAMNTLPEAETLHTLYTLWLGGVLARGDWNPAFSDVKIAAIQAARLEIKKEAVEVKVDMARTQDPETPAGDAAPAVVVPPPAKEISLEEYLERVETADTYYDLLGVDAQAEVAEMKRSYFGLAKQFHPDRFHTAGSEMLARIQNAFTVLAQSYETLKNAESRETYDFKIRKELAEREKRRVEGTVGERSVQAEQGLVNFDRGFSLLMDEEYEEALPFLARAVHFNPKNALYHAYYGKALSGDHKQRHKAEAEMQTALKLEPNNPTFRILLAEFFIQYNLLKRAEGELNRLLAIFPSNREARELLDSLQI